MNAMNQFNSGQFNAISQFNSQTQNQREQWNAQNEMVVAQSNVAWRRQIATADTAATNRTNEINASNALQVSQQAYANMWQERADNFKREWQTAENTAQLLNNMAIAKLQEGTKIEVASMQQSGQAAAGIGGAIVDIILS